MSSSGGPKEAFSRVVIDAQLDDVGWNLTDGQSVRYEYQLPDFAEQIEPIYIYALFQNVNVRRELSKLSTGTSASMRNISQAKLKTLKLPVPPYEEQMKFVDQVRQIQAIQTQQSIALDTATDTFNSVLSRAFNGRL